jgi:tetratricopeptide (TPR) repeat protein
LTQGSAAAPQPPEPKPSPDDSAETRALNEQRCQSDDANARLTGCTAIIDARGKGYRVALADAYDGRCRSYNEQRMYDRAVQDCKAAIDRNSRNKYAYNNLGAAFAGLGDTKGALAAYSSSTDLDQNWIYPRLDRGRIYADMGEKDKAKNDFDKVLSIDPSNQQAKDALALIQVDSPTLIDARLFLEDAKQFVSESKQAPESISQIVNAAVDLEVALKGFNEPAASRAKTRLTALLVPLPGFQEFVNGRQEDRNRANKERLMTVIEKSTIQHVCADNYVKRDIGNPKNAAVNRLREELDYAVKQQNITAIEKASSAFEDFSRTNGIPCDLPPVERGPAADATLLKNFRVYLDDVQAFLRTQPDVDQEKIVNIAQIARRLQDAVTKSNETEAKQLKSELDNLLQPVDGFNNFMVDKEEQRRRELVRQFTLESAKAEKNIYFITEYLRENLVYPKTETISSLRIRLDSGRRPSSVSEASVNMLNKANEALDVFVRDNSLSSDYVRIVATFDHTPVKGPVNKPALELTSKNKIALDGPDEDMVFLYNSASSAPSIAKDISGKFIFLTGGASVCFVQSAGIDEDRRWFLERTLRQDGAKDLKEDSSLCDFGKAPTGFDLIVFQRSELRKQRMDYLIGLTDLLQNDALREYKVVSGPDYDRAIQGIRAQSLQIARDVESQKITGFGVIIVTDVGSPACAVAGDRVTEIGLLKLLQRDKELISRRLRFNWNIVNMTVDSAFVALTRQQCGYVAGNASTLKTLMLALRGDGRNYEFAPIWFSTEDVVFAGTEAIKRRDALEKVQTDQKNMDEAKSRQEDAQKQVLEDKLRKENGPRARALRDKIDGVVKADAFKPLTDKPRKATETQGPFPAFASWLNRRFDDQWETTEVTSEIEDYGKVQWNGRTLNGIFVKTTVTQKNRIKGAYETSCFMLGLVDDEEFSMSRDMFAVQCGSSTSMLDDWKARREFRSLWNSGMPRQAESRPHSSSGSSPLSILLYAVAYTLKLCLNWIHLA